MKQVRQRVELTPWPGPMSLRGGRARWIFAGGATLLAGVICGVYLAGVGAARLSGRPAPLGDGVAMAPAGAGEIAILFALAALLAGVGLLFGWMCLRMVWPGPPTLTLTGEGFAFRRAFGDVFTRWEDAGGFTVWDHSRARRMVIFDDRTLSRRWLARMNARFSGRNASLPDTYGLDADRLAALMQEWRDAAIRAKIAP